MTGQLFSWQFNANVLSTNSFKTYVLLQALSKQSTLPANAIKVNRKELSERMGLSYNTVQDSLKELLELGMIVFTEKNLINLNPVNKFNRTKIMSLLLKQLDSSKTDESHEDEIP